MPDSISFSAKHLGNQQKHLFFEVRTSPSARLIPMAMSQGSDRRTTSLLIRFAAFAAILASIGCASPGPPRAPTLSLPEPVRDLAVNHIGNTVELHFTAPARTTDKLPIGGGTVTGQFCRQLDHQPCVTVPSSKATLDTVGPKGTRDNATWTDTLPADLVQGSPRLLAYRVEFFSPAGRSGGLSAPAFTLAGPAPAPVVDLHAEGSRLGVVLSWNASAQAGEVLLRREDLAPADTKANKTPGSHNATASPIVWLRTHDPNDSAPTPNRTLDTSAHPGTPYTYTAQRSLTVQLGGHSIEVRSALAAPLHFTLREIYPPLAPTGLTAVGFFADASTGTSAPFAVDLIWQPTDDTGLLATLAGYNIYRETLSTAGESTTPRTRLNTSPIPMPSFHDTTANPAKRYRYSVSAIDAKGNQSPAVTVLLESSTAP